MIRDEMKTVPNLITAVRLVLLFLLWVPAWGGKLTWIGWGIVIFFVLDVLDGYVARRLNQMSAWGSQFDSIADNILSLFVLAWIIWLKPDVIQDHRWLFLATGGMYLLSNTIGWFKFHRISNMHLQSSRVGAVVQTIVFGYLFIAPVYQPIFLYVALGWFIYSRSEEVAIYLMSDEVNAHMVSVWRVWARRKAIKSS